MRIKYPYFILCWTLLNLLQGAFTELTSDEGYYWYYSTSLEWGYYDHPPFLAWMIKAGYSIFPNALGVRLMSILVNSATLYLFFKLLGNGKKEINVFLLLLATPLLNYLAFIVFPDGPLLFFSLAFLWAYKKFLQKENLAIALLMGISMAGMLYSKYYGVLVVAFTILSNTRLLRSPYFYISGLIALLLFLPHLYWQFTNDFQTFRYHLSGRVSGFSMKHVWEYLPQQLLAIGPALLLVPFVYRSGGTFERSLKFIVAGTFIFFLFTSLRTFVHFHWTSIAIFPLLFMGASYYDHPGRKKLLLGLTLPFIVLLFLVRLQLFWPVFGIKHVGIDYYHGRQEWAKEIAELSSGKPVVFINDFRESALYSFYSGQTGFALFTGERRRSQYDLWQYEDSLRDKDVLLLSRSPFEGAGSFRSGIGKEYFTKVIRGYLSYYNVKVKIKDLQRSGPDSFLLSIEMYNPGKSALPFREDGSGHSPVLYYGFESNGNRNFVKQDTLRVMSEADRIVPGQSVDFRFRLPLPKELAPRRIAIGFQYGILPDSYNYIRTWNLK